MDALDILFTASFWVAAIRIASPLIFATMGELICERAGVLNLGIEGIMTAGAFAGWFTVYAGGDLWTGVLVAALAGAMFGLLHAMLTVPLGLSQHVAGIGITLLATSLTYYTYRLAFPEVTSPPKIEPFQPLAIPGLSSIPVVGEALFRRRRSPISPSSRSRVVAWVLYRTPLGLAVRAVGENPAAVEAQGIGVTGMRMGAVMAGSALMGVGGAFLTMSAFNSFFFEMVNGRGWICIALVVFGSWRPGKALLGAHPVRRLRRLSGAAAAAVRRRRALPGVPDDALCAVDPGACSGRAARHLSAGADDPLPERRKMSFDLIVKGGTLPDGRDRRHRHSWRQDRGDRAVDSRPRRARSSTLPAAWCRRPSSIRISTWTRPCPTAFRASTPRARCSKASRCGAS